MKAGLIQAGEEITYEGEEGILLRDGWIEWFTDKYSDPEGWIIGVRFTSLGGICSSY